MLRKNNSTAIICGYERIVNMDIKTKAEDFLLNLGVPPQIKGYAMLADAITM